MGARSGVGLDPKPVSFSSSAQRWFGLDLREMLREREERFTRYTATAANYVPVAVDLRFDTWDQILLEAGLQPNLPTLFIAEGISMYLTGDEFTRLLHKLHTLAASLNTRIWIDHVTSSLFHLDVLEVKAFLSSMTRLGEPFIFGFDDVLALDSNTWVSQDIVSAADVLGLSDAVHQEYRFSILKPA